VSRVAESPDITVVVGRVFTVARVGDEIAAALWKSSNSAFYVADGTGAASEFDSEREAMGRLLSIAMRAAGGGAASVIHQQEGGTNHG
jgi:hypothetical protein